MEFVLILSELNDYDEETKILCEIIDDVLVFEELRAAAVWGLKVSEKTIEKILQSCFSNSEIILSHAIALLENNMEEKYTMQIIRKIKDDNTGSVCFRILTNAKNVDKNLIVKEFSENNDVLLNKWLFLIIGFSGRVYYEEIINRVVDSENIKHYLDLIWNYIDNKMDQKYQNAVEFVNMQGIKK